MLVVFYKVVVKKMTTTWNDIKLREKGLIRIGPKSESILSSNIYNNSSELVGNSFTI